MDSTPTCGRSRHGVVGHRNLHNAGTGSGVRPCAGGASWTQSGCDRRRWRTATGSSGPASGGHWRNSSLAAVMGRTFWACWNAPTDRSPLISGRKSVCRLLRASRGNCLGEGSAHGSVIDAVRSGLVPLPGIPRSTVAVRRCPKEPDRVRLQDRGRFARGGRQGHRTPPAVKGLIEHVHQLLSQPVREVSSRTRCPFLRNGSSTSWSSRPSHH